MPAGEVTVSAEFEERTSSAAFTVDANGKQVAFSQGNLQCSGVTSGNYVWSFAENQYDIPGTANVSGGTASYDDDEGYSKSGSALADKIDLFGWSGDEGSAKWGVSDSETKADYYGEFADLGQNIGNGTTYYTLTYEEWDYLFNVRTNASEKIGVAQIQISDTQYANGIILLPDSRKRPTGVTFKSGFAEDGESLMQMYAAHQTFTLAEWQQLEAAGAVFLPASGNRSGSYMTNVQRYGHYWSATPGDTDRANVFYFGSNNAEVDGILRFSGRSVRLVQAYAQDKYTIITHAENGTVTGGGAYASGTEVVLTATPETGYQFLQWSDGNTDNPRTITVTEDLELTAIFVSVPSAIGDATGTSDAAVRKVLIDGQIYILRGNTTYTLTGEKVDR